MSEELLEYEWLGPERMVPNYGQPKTGDKIYLPPEIGSSFVKQGLAKSVTATRVESKTSSQSKK